MSSQFECSVCAFDKDESATLIDASPVCHECILDIIPKFHAALKYEAQYPVEWSSCVILKPQDFADHFDDYPAFIKQWEERMKEYSMPETERLYCQCSLFLGRRHGPLGPDHLFRLFCPACERWVCRRCGAEQCRSECTSGEEADPIKDMPDVQRCVNEKCRLVVSLQDGCNDVECTACRSRFCWICRVSNPAKSHWDRGMPCPRFNKPGSANAIYNDDIDDLDDALMATEGVPEAMEIMDLASLRLEGAESVIGHEGVEEVLDDVWNLAVPPSMIANWVGQISLQRWLAEHNLSAPVPGQQPSGINLDQLFQEEHNLRHALEDTAPAKSCFVIDSLWTPSINP